jgi:hypothetical protein
MLIYAGRYSRATNHYNVVGGNETSICTVGGGPVLYENTIRGKDLPTIIVISTGLS